MLAASRVRPLLVASPTAAATTADSIPLVQDATDDVLAAADLVITASGTATVQTALHGPPMVIVYKLSPMTYVMGRLFVKVPSYGMVNLIAGRKIVPELIQQQCTSAAVAAEAVSLLTDNERATRMREDLAAVRTALGGPGASRRAAAAVWDIARRARVGNAHAAF